MFKFCSRTLSIFFIYIFLCRIVANVYADDEDAVQESQTTYEITTSTPNIPTDSELKEADPVSEREFQLGPEITTVTETNIEITAATTVMEIVGTVTESDAVETTEDEEVVTEAAPEIEVASITETNVAVVIITEAETTEIAVIEDAVNAVTDINISGVTETEGPSITEVIEVAEQEEKVADTHLTENLESVPEAVTNINLATDNIPVVDDTRSDTVTAATVEQNKETEATELDIDNEVESDLIGNMVFLAQFRNKNYFYSETFKVNYFQAYEICKDLGMSIISIISKEENDFFFKNLKKSGENNHRYWTSGSKFLTGKNWIWMTTGQMVGYTNWLPGKPSENTKNCIYIITESDDLRWNNEDCTAKLSFICESDGMFYNSPRTEISNLLGILVGSFEFPVFNYNKKRYYIVNDLNLSFFDASRACQLIGLELVTVASKEENINLYEHIRNSMAGTNFWSGGTSTKNSSNWIWLPSGKNVTYTNWQEANLKNDDDKKCLQLIFKTDVLEWDAMNCNSPQNFICETPNGMTQLNGIKKKPDVVESIPKDINKINPSTFKIKIIPPLRRKYVEWYNERAT